MREGVNRLVNLFDPDTGHFRQHQGQQDTHGELEHEAAEADDDGIPDGAHRVRRLEDADEMIQAAQNAGSKVFYRLGTSIEHSGEKHFNAIPPKDYEKYAEVLAGIVRHYTRGWANGHHYKIRYWEIWNEPNNGPMWDAL